MLDLIYLWSLLISFICTTNSIVYRQPIQTEYVLFFLAWPTKISNQALNGTRGYLINVEDLMTMFSQTFLKRVIALTPAKGFVKILGKQLNTKCRLLTQNLRRQTSFQKLSTKWMQMFYRPFNALPRKQGISSMVGFYNLTFSLTTSFVVHCSFISKLL